MASRRDLRGQDPQGRQAGRSAGPAADQVRASDQPQDREGAWSRRSADAARPCRRGDRVRRREFITLLGGAAAAWPLAARAQQLSKLPRIGFLQRVRNENVVAFIQALRDPGYVDGQNAVIETRIFETTLDRVPDFAKELVDLKCD